MFRRLGVAVAVAPARKSKRTVKAKFRVRRRRETKVQRRARAAEMVRRLHLEYPDADCALHYSSPWELLVATILSAQCTDKRVNQETPALFARYPSIRDMAEAAQEDVEELVRRTGFFRNKARALREAAATIVASFGGELPLDMDGLLTLRGVARKTANVVLGTAFGVPSGVVVDTHVHRLSHRLDLSREDDPDKIERDLMGLIPQDEWIFTGHALIWHGRRVCDARKPECDRCVLSDVCPSSTAS